MARRERGGRRGKGAALTLLRSNRVSRRLIVEPLRKLTQQRGRVARAGSGFAHLDRLRIVFLYGRNPAEDHYSAQVQRGIDEAVAALPVEQRARFELRMLSSGPLTTFDGLAHADQEAILDAVVPFVLQCFEGTPAARLDSRRGLRTMREAALSKSWARPAEIPVTSCCLPVDSFG